jgi:hypothetical protein
MVLSLEDKTVSDWPFATQGITNGMSCRQNS